MTNSNESKELSRLQDKLELSQKENKTLQSKLDKTVKALEFYANERNWEESIDNPSAFCIIKYCDAEEREATYECIGGKKARETLKQIKEGEYE
jgi:hypothetical protein